MAQKSNPQQQQNPSRQNQDNNRGSENPNRKPSTQAPGEDEEE